MPPIQGDAKLRSGFRFTGERSKFRKKLPLFCYQFVTPDLMVFTVKPDPVVIQMSWPYLG